MKKLCSFIGILLVLTSVVFCITGFNKKNKYISPEKASYGYDTQNAYVGGDAYNYIINSGYFAGYMALSAGLFVSGSIFIVNGIKNND